MLILKPCAPSTKGLHRSRVAQVVAVLSFLVMISLAGCGGNATSGPTQVVATVAGEEITELQVNQALERQQGLKPDQLEAVSRKLVTGLVDQEIILQKARDLKLDRDQRVVQNAEAAKREITVRAYLERIADGVGKPSNKDIQAYYEANPALFKERRIYSFQEVSVQASGTQRAAIEKQLTLLKTPNELEAYLKAQQIPARSERSTTAAENIPLPLLQRISTMKPGQGLILPTADGVRIVLLLSTQDAPVAEDKASSAISAFLISKRKREAVEKEVVSLRSGVKVAYFGKYADLAASGASGVSGAPGAASAAAATTQGSLGSPSGLAAVAGTQATAAVVDSAAPAK